MRHRGIEAKKWVGLVVGVVIAFLCGCGAKQESLRRFEFTRLEMGVRTRVVLYASSDELAEHAAQAAFSRIADLDACMSDYRPDSELMKLCAAPPGVPRLTSDDLFRVLVASQQVSQASDGAFDVSAGPLVALWREARRTGQLPFGESIAQAKEHVGWEDIELESKTACVTLKKPGMKLDLGGIAKGYAAQQAVETLQNLGCERCLVGLAGDLCVGDPPPGEKGWTIDVAPAPGRSTHARSLLLKNMSISTSGDSEQFVEIGGRRYSHIVDPRTGMATTTRVQATVISRSGEKADALATAICVLGPAKGGGLARQMSVAAIVNEPDSPEVIINEERLRWEKP